MSTAAGDRLSHDLPPEVKGLLKPLERLHLEVALRMNLLSAVLAAPAVGLLYPTVRSLLRQSTAALSPAAERLVAAGAAMVEHEGWALLYVHHAV